MLLVAFQVAPRDDEPFFTGHSLTYWALRYHRGSTNSNSQQRAGRSRESLNSTAHFVLSVSAPYSIVPLLDQANA